MRNSEGGVQPARVTVNLPPRATQALERLKTETGDNQTDVIKMALLLYAAVWDLIRSPEGDGKTLRVLKPGLQVRTGETVDIVFIG